MPETLSPPPSPEPSAPSWKSPKAVADRLAELQEGGVAAFYIPGSKKLYSFSSDGYGSTSKLVDTWNPYSEKEQGDTLRLESQQDFILTHKAEDIVLASPPSSSSPYNQALADLYAKLSANPNPIAKADFDRKWKAKFKGKPTTIPGIYGEVKIEKGDRISDLLHTRFEVNDDVKDFFSGTDHQGSLQLLAEPRLKEYFHDLGRRDDLRPAPRRGWKRLGDAVW